MEPLGLADVDSFVAYRKDPEVARFQSWDTNYSKQQAIALVESQAGVTLPAEGEWLQIALRSKTSGDLVGDLALHSLSLNDLTFELGFTIAREHQKQGYAKEALAKLMEYLFTELSATKLIAHTDSRNTAANKLLFSLGFVKGASRGWTEIFKDELVTVEYFEAIAGAKAPSK